MLGWMISVYRQPDGTLPATAESPRGARMAVWQTGWRGLDWLNGLVKAGSAIHLGGDGYPFRYTARAKEILPSILSGPPNANATWRHDPGDVLLDEWLGKTTVDDAALGQCSPDEWLLIVAWDES